MIATRAGRPVLLSGLPKPGLSADIRQGGAGFPALPAASGRAVRR